jgi:triacylglycerol lipase
MGGMHVPGWWGGLSPRRRLLMGVVLLAVVASAVTAVVVIGRRGPAPTTGAPDQGKPGPVLLVPGYGGGQGALEQLADRIHRATGREADVLTLVGDGTGDLRQQVGVLAGAVNRAYAEGAPSVDVIGYSAGGIVARLWVARDGGEHQARRIVTLGTPMHGTTLATTGGVVAPSACPTACQQLTPGSALLSQLPPLPAGLPWLSVWTSHDETVTPPESARLDGALNVALQQVCPNDTATHDNLPTDPEVTALVLDELGAADLHTPASCPVVS